MRDITKEELEYLVVLGEQQEMNLGWKQMPVEIAQRLHLLGYAEIKKGERPISRKVFITTKGVKKLKEIL